jgi:hypothetical protein
MGDGFALLEMKLVLAMLLLQYRLAPRDVRVDRAGFPVIRPKRGLPVVVYKQDHRFHAVRGSVLGNVREMVDLPS